MTTSKLGSSPFLGRALSWGFTTLRWILFVSAAAAILLWPLALPRHDQYNIVHLDGYGSFSGTIITSSQSGTELPQPVDAWLGIEYAAQPVGDARFRPVAEPSSFDGVKAANEYGKVCPQNAAVQSVENQDEACLNFNVFRTQGVPFNERLPVLVWIHGGSFNTGGSRNFDGASFVARSDSPLMVVTFHYRLGSLGFLPSALFSEEDLLNLGLRDQHFFLQFLQTHIASFGGDPAAVTLGGQSAGAHAVGIQYFHGYGNDDAVRGALFARAIHESGSVTARAFPNATYPLYVEQMNDYMGRLDCSLDDGNSNALDCLRSADVDRIRNVTTDIYREYDRPLTWPFQPVQGGPLFEKPGSQSGYDETFFHVPVVTTTTTDEGRLFVPGDIQTNQEFVDYMHNLSPALTEQDIQQLEDLYPDPSTHPDSPYASSPRSKQYSRLAAAYGDYAYICPSVSRSMTLDIHGSRADISIHSKRLRIGCPLPASPCGRPDSTPTTISLPGRASRTRPTLNTLGERLMCNTPR